VGGHDFVATLAGFTSLSLDDESIWFFSHSRICMNKCYAYFMSLSFVEY
jgi:hypothetical protein